MDALPPREGVLNLLSTILYLTNGDNIALRRPLRAEPPGGETAGLSSQGLIRVIHRHPAPSAVA